eukprot:PhF_6_TR42696/c1_g1_i3/m.64453
MCTAMFPFQAVQLVANAKNILTSTDPTVLDNENTKGFLTYHVTNVPAVKDTQWNSSTLCLSRTVDGVVTCAGLPYNHTPATYCTAPRVNTMYVPTATRPVNRLNGVLEATRCGTYTADRSNTPDGVVTSARLRSTTPRRT